MSEQIKVLIADRMDPKAAAIFRERAIHVDEKPGLSAEELQAILGQYDGLAVRSSTKVTAARSFHDPVPTLRLPGARAYPAVGPRPGLWLPGEPPR